MEAYIIETARLGMREMEERDIPALRGYLTDPQVMHAFGGAFDEDKVQGWYQRQLERYAAWQDFGSWALVLRETGEVIGQCGLTLATVRGVEHMEVGYILARPHWGRGYAIEGARASRDFAFGRLGRRSVISRIRCDNAPSINVAIRNGMLAQDCLPDELGSNLFTLVFGMDEAQWLARQRLGL